MYERDVNRVLRARLLEPRRTIQFLHGPRQVGKTTTVSMVLADFPLGSHYASADAPEVQTRAWVREQWEAARALHATTGAPVVLALDEVQKVPLWSDTVKALWDEDTRAERDVRVAVLGSAPWLMSRGMRESLAGRFETIRATHWTFPECRDAFGWDLPTFLFHGGYPGAAPFVDDFDRWRTYVMEMAVEASVAREVLAMTRVDKPALLRQALYLGCEYSGRELSLQKMRGALEDAGSLTTLAHYLDLLDEAGLLSALQKHAGQAARRRASVPKLQVRNNALLSAVTALPPAVVRADPERWGRVAESAVGAHLAERASQQRARLTYWRDGTNEVDFVYTLGGRTLAIKVKTSTDPRAMRGLVAFKEAFDGDPELLVVGEGGITIERFLSGEAGV